MEADCSFIDYSFINFAGAESLLTTSQYAKVIFHNVHEKYSVTEDLQCEYSLTDQFTANPGDRIVLFRLGWQQITDYVMFEWAPVPQDKVQLRIRFKADHLPRDANEFYQLCYITSENAVCGASVPFQFTNLTATVVNLGTSVNSDCFVSLQMDDSKVFISSSGISSQSSSLDTDDITVKTLNLPKCTCISDVNLLNEKNTLLESELAKTTISLQRCDDELNNLKSEVENLKSMIHVTHNDVAELKLRMDMANDEYKKMYAEKSRVERKYDKLVKKCQRKRSLFDSTSTSSDISCDSLGELDPLPPFPLLI